MFRNFYFDAFTKNLKLNIYFILFICEAKINLEKILEKTIKSFLKISPNYLNIN